MNGKRSNYPYGITSSGTSYRGSGDPTGNRLGTTTNTSYVKSGTVFEPFESRKGDLARIYFYAVAMYLKNGAQNGAVKNWTGGGEVDGSKTIFGSGTGYKSFIYSNYLNMLLDWHKNDPVSADEIKFNNAIEGVQKNRNPFIDHPSWVDIIWGGTYGASQQNGEDTSNGNAVVVNGQIEGTTPSTDPTITINPTSLTLTEGGSTGTITATVANGSGNVTWESSDTDVVTVSSSGTNQTTCTVTPVAAGTTTITASYSTATPVTCSVTVNSSGGGGDDPEVESEILDFTAQSYSDQEVVESLSGTYSSVSLDKGTGNNDPKYFSNGTSVRCYGGNTFTVSSSTKTIKKIELTFGSSDGSNAITTDVGTYSSGTWTGSASSITFTIGGTSGNRRIQKITVYYESSTPTPTPVISLNKSSDEISVGDDTSLTATASGGTGNITWSISEGDEGVVSLSSTTGTTITITGESEGTATITATYSGVSATCEITVSSSVDPVVSGDYTMTLDSSVSGQKNVHWTSASQASLEYDNVTWSTSITGTTSITTQTEYAQIGSKNNPATKITISTTAFAGMKITSASLTGYCMSNTGPTITITAGSTTMLNAQSLVKNESTVYETTSDPVILPANGVLTFTINSSAKAGIAISEIVVNYVDIQDVAEKYAKSFMESGICGTNDKTPASASIWNSMNQAFQDIDEDAQDILTEGIANPSDTKYLGKCLARYDRILYLHGKDTTHFPDFMHRNDENGANQVRGLITNKSNTTLILIMISITSTMIGFIFVGYYLKKKER